MKKCMLSKGIAIVLIAGLFCGCAGKKVNYEMDTDETAENSQGAITKLSQFSDAEKWTDILEFETENGEKKTISINAEITLPEADSMSVVEEEESVFDAEFKKQILNSFFSGGEIYYHDLEHWTREELEETIEDIEEKIDLLEIYIAQAAAGTSGDSSEESEFKEEKEALEEEIQQKQKLLETAPAAPVTAEEFDNCNEYLGYVGEMPCVATFSDEENNRRVTIVPDIYYGPERLKGKEYYRISTIATHRNECPLSIEEAFELSEQCVKGLGLGSQVCLRKNGVSWIGMNYIEQPQVYESIEEFYGYCFTYVSGIDGIAFQQVDTSNLITSFDCGKNSIKYTENNYGEMNFIQIEVMEKGVVSIRLFSPAEVIKVTKSVELLPLDTIKEIMKNEAYEHADKYEYFSSNETAEKMELIYFRVKDKEKEGVFSYIPVWQLTPSGNYYHPILVNAIDGSIIYYWEEIGS